MAESASFRDYILHNYNINHIFFNNWAHSSG